jgi:hypothetical protein
VAPIPAFPDVGVPIETDDAILDSDDAGIVMNGGLVDEYGYPVGDATMAPEYDEHGNIIITDPTGIIVNGNATGVIKGPDSPYGGFGRWRR